jgi:serine/threonine protein phosphatase 1
LRPEIDIDDQSDRDLLWIRGAFLNENHDFGKPVVHGHSPERANPVASQFKVSLDTACFGTGRLAIARFEPGERAPTLKVIGPKEMETHREPEIPNVLTQ